MMEHESGKPKFQEFLDLPNETRQELIFYGEARMDDFVEALEVESPTAELHMVRGLDEIRKKNGRAKTLKDMPKDGIPDPDEWPEPEPLFSPPDCPNFPIDALPAGIRGAIEEVIGFVQCPVELAVSSALGHLSLCVQHLVDVSRCDKLVGPVSVFTLTVGESGERKTKCDDLFGEVVKQWENDQKADFKEVMEVYEGEMESWQSDVDGLKSAIKRKTAKGDDPAADKDAMKKLHHRKPVKPQEPILTYEDTTPEALAYDVSRNRPSAGVFSSEAGLVLGAHGMNERSVMRNLALLNTLWENGRCKIRRRTVESFAITSARLTICLATQFDTLKKFFTATNGHARSSGFSARFLLVKPESTQGTRFFKHPPDSWPRLGAFSRRLRAFLDEPMPVDEQGDMAPATLRLAPEAQDEWIAYHDDVERELAPGGEMEYARDVASKSADNAARIAALFHIFEHGVGGQIDVDSMRRGAALAGFYLYSGRHVLGELAAKDDDTDAARLDAWLLDHCRKEGEIRVTTRSISQFGPNPVRKKEARDAALIVLTDHGRVRIKKAGRATYVEVNPDLLMEVSP